MTWGDTVYLLPEVILTLGACFLLLAPVIGFRTDAGTAKVAMLAVLAVTIVALFVSSWAVGDIPQTRGFASMFVLDKFSLFFKLLFLVTIAMVTLLSDRYLRGTRYSAWEYYSLMGFALIGMMFMASGVHLATIYVGLELMSLSSYVLAGYFKNEQKSTEAAMKYFVLGAVSSAILLYGITLIYGVTGSLNLLTISSQMSQLVTNDALMFGIMLLGAGLCFKIAAAPFHVWTPDVYEGAPTPITAFLSTASKAAAFAIFVRIFYVGMHHFRLDWQNVLAIVAALSMIVGNLAAITQDNVKRMIAYSSIGHAGYVLLGILAVSEMGLRGVLVYSVVYVFATLGIWACVLVLAQTEYAGERVEDFDGLHRRAPFWAFAMIVFLLSLGGIPPTAGFIGKYFLFYAAVGAGFGWLAIIAVLMSAVSIFYYFRLVTAMYFRDGKGTETPVVAGGGLMVVGVVCLIATLVLGVLPSRFIDEVIRTGDPVTRRLANAGR
ncbi:MAG TPA: NADH-quinone oxidoreductase subunit N [Thermoanaerobaculia bacterium]|nr:NADH-quinone oxidoreductase subunit N [Thermoanaerobaculia bacterium]